MNSVIFASAVLAVVSFKDAKKIKSWDAWSDHEAKVALTNVLQKEKACVTWKRLNRLDFRDSRRPDRGACVRDRAEGRPDVGFPGADRLACGRAVRTVRREVWCDFKSLKKQASVVAILMLKTEPCLGWRSANPNDETERRLPRT